MVVENGFLSSRAEEESVGGRLRKFDGQSGFVRGLCVESLALFSDVDPPALFVAYASLCNAALHL